MLAETRIIYDTHVNTTSDYFRRLGGSGRYDGYEEWHSLALTLLVGLRALDLADRSQIENCLMILPKEIRFGCDNIAEEVEKEFDRKNLTLEGDKKFKVLEDLGNFWSHTTRNCNGFWFSGFDECFRSLLDGSSR